MALEVQGGNQLSYVDTSFAPNPAANECGGMYERVTYYPMSCDAVASSQYPKMKRVNNLRQSIMTLDGGDKLKVYLMPASQNCVAIKKEVVYR